LKRDSKRAKSEIAMSKSNFSEWPTRAGVGGEGAESLILHYSPLSEGCLERTGCSPLSAWNGKVSNKKLLHNSLVFICKGTVKSCMFPFYCI